MFEFILKIIVLICVLISFTVLVGIVWLILLMINSFTDSKPTYVLAEGAVFTATIESGQLRVLSATGAVKR